MSTLFGVSMDAIMATLLVVCIATAGALGVLALRHRVLLRLALRNLARRRGQTALIVVGLMLSTAIITSSFATGDTMSTTARSVVADTLGRVDEVIIAPSLFRGGRLGPQGLSGLPTGYFPMDDYQRLRPSILAIPGVAGVAPAITEQVSLVDASSHQSKESVTIVALPPDYDRAFGSLTRLDGGDASVGALGPDELYLNREGADALGAARGDEIDLFFGSTRVMRHLKAVVHDGGPGGAQPVVLLPLAALQQLRGHEGEINQIFVANQGDTLTSDRWSVSVTRHIGALLVDGAVAEQIRDVVRTPAVRAAVLESSSSLPTDQQATVSTFLDEASHAGPNGTPSEQFRSLLADRTVLTRLATASFRLRDRATGNHLIQLLRQATTLTASDVKHQGLATADVVGAASTSIFVGLGLFSIASGVLLIYLIFVLLAAERRTEMGVARAIGVRREHLVQMFLFEGAVYDLGAAVVGVILGLGVGLATVRFLAAVLETVDVHVRFSVEPRSVVVAACLGLLVTFITVGGSAWRVSRLNIVAAMRNLPHPRPLSIAMERGGSHTPLHRNGEGPGVRLLAGPLLTLIGVAGIAAARQSVALLPVRALGTSLAIVGAALTARHVLGWLRLDASVRDRLCFTAAGIALLVYWASPFNFLSSMRPRDLQAGVELYFLAGIAMVAGAVWAVVYNADAAIVPLAAMGGRLFPVAAVLRTSAAYALRQRFRTGMALAMFALVVFTMVVASVLSTATQRAYGDVGLQQGGFDVRGDTRYDTPIPNMQAALASAPGVRSSDVSAVGGFATTSGYGIETSADNAVWGSAALNAVDSGFLESTTFHLAVRASGYRDDKAVWRALETTAGLAIVDSGALVSAPGDLTGRSSFALSRVFLGATSMAPATVWVRADSSHPVKLTVIGVLDPRAGFGAGLTASRATFEPVIDMPWGHTWYFRVAHGHDVHTVARGLGLSFADQGMQAQVLGDEQQKTQGVRLLLNQLLQSYMGLGLIVGVASLGVMSTRAVVERRQQIGVMRALGFQRRMVQAGFLLEAAGIALGGVALGIALGLQLARSLTHYIGLSHPEIVFSVPWSQLLLIAAAACVASLAATWLPASAASGVPPAAALRYE